VRLDREVLGREVAIGGETSRSGFLILAMGGHD
jgi:hypothetical protein